MGAAHSGEAVGEENESSSPDNNNNSKCGFSPREAQHLVSLRQAVGRRDLGRGLLSATCDLSLLLSPGSSTIRDISSDSQIESRTCDRSPPEAEFVRRRCEKLNAMGGIDVALEGAFNEADDEDCFLERMSNLLGMNGRREGDSPRFVWTSCGGVAGGSVPARKLIDVCLRAASVSHAILREPEASGVGGASGTGEPIWTGDRTVAEGGSAVVRSLADSLLEYVRDSRDGGNFAYAATGAAVSPISEGEVTEAEFAEWRARVVPDLISCSVSRLLRVVLLPPESFPSWDMRPFPIPRSSREVSLGTKSRLNAGEIMSLRSAVFGDNTALTLLPEIFAFASISMAKFGERWYRIFAGADDGWTFQSLERAIMGYEGPTLLVMTASCEIEKGTVTLGAYTASKWERSRRDFFGTSDCFLFQLKPVLRVLRPLPKMGTRGGHYMYFHSNTNVSSANPTRKDDAALGLGFGGTVRAPRLFVDSGLEECRVSDRDTSFEEGRLGFPPSDDPFSSQVTSSSTLRIESLEVYAVGDENTIDHGFQAQSQHRDIADAALRNARTVDKAAFLGDMRSGAIESKAFAHRGQVDGRAHGYMKGEDEDGG